MRPCFIRPAKSYLGCDAKLAPAAWVCMSIDTVPARREERRESRSALGVAVAQPASARAVLAAAPKNVRRDMPRAGLVMCLIRSSIIRQEKARASDDT